jgi:two-component system, chemotaxis family, response regulator Rcp1
MDRRKPPRHTKFAGLRKEEKAKDGERQATEGPGHLAGRTFGTATDGRTSMDILRTIRLLVVEDNPAYLYLIQKAFSGRMEQTRWELTVATDGEEALHVLFEKENKSAPLPDLILLDWNLPKLSGGEVLQRVKQHQQLRRIPVLVLSASEADRDIHAAYDNHANGFITKPWGDEALSATVEAIERFWVALRLPKVLR